MHEPAPLNPFGPDGRSTFTGVVMRGLLTPTRPIRLLTAVAVAGALALGSTVALAAVQPRMGTAANYAVMATSTITNTGPTTVTGNVAISPGGPTSVTGFPPGVYTGELDAANADAVLAHTDLIVAYNDAAGQTTTRNLTGTDLGGLTLTPGTYTFDSSAQLTGTLTLDGGGDTNAVFIFQIGSTLTTASASSVTTINGSAGNGVYWNVGSSATLGTTTSFLGNIIAGTGSVGLNTGATIICGRAISLTAAVTLDNNTISGDCTNGGNYDTGLTDYGSLGFSGGSDDSNVVPEPAALTLLATGMAALAAKRRRTS